MERQDLANRFAYHAPDDDKRQRHERVRTDIHDTAVRVNELCPDSREKSLAITALEEAMFWANAAIARHDGATGARV